MEKKENQAIKKGWPTRAVMHQIYDKKLWGGAEFDFYSGEGSHEDAIVKPYIAKASAFLDTFNIPLSVCDVGCGDFNIGQQLLNYTGNYIGVDIVANLVARNTKKFVHKKLEFRCLDISNDLLPKTDCLFVRQVLQHLSNADILAFLPKLCLYKYVLLTEHVPEHSFTPNRDKVTSMGNRLKQNSGVILTEAPFNYAPMTSEVLLRIPASKDSVIQTILYQNF